MRGRRTTPLIMAHLASAFLLVAGCENGESHETIAGEVENGMQIDRSVTRGPSSQPAAHLADVPTVAKNALANVKVATLVIDIYSGRRNPTCPLTPRQLQYIESSVASSVISTDDPDAAIRPSKLGYRGFAVLTTDGKEIEVYRDKIRVTDADKQRTLYEDHDESLEAFLIRTGNSQHELPPLFD